MCDRSWTRFAFLLSIQENPEQNILNAVDGFGHMIPPCQLTPNESGSACGRATRTGAGVERRRYQNIDRLAAGIAGHEHVYDQLTSGALEAELDCYTISERTGFFVENVNRCIRKQFQVLPGQVRIGFTLADYACHVNAVPLPMGAANINLASTPVDLHFGKNSRGCWVRLAESDVASMLPPGHAPRLLGRTGRFEVRGSSASLFRKMIHAAREQMLDRSPLVALPKAIAALERLIISAAAGLLAEAIEPECRNEPRRTPATHRAHLLKQACETIDARLCEGLTMSELCAAIGTSRRTLETIFIEQLDVTPYQYVRALRLNAVHRELSLEQNSEVSIGDIAAKWGIWHLSRFAADYHRLFGKLPSQERCDSRRRALTGA